jgi:hypothetical protein
MKNRFLFRLDGSKDNDDFFLRRRSQSDVLAYSGTTLIVGPGWIPDLVEVETNDDGTRFFITLIELEGSEIVARVSCRKYLPEPSSDVVHRFIGYLDTLITQCQVTADPRLDDLRALRGSLEGEVTVIVRTAGALRSSGEFLELHALLDQPERITIESHQSAIEVKTTNFEGTRSFSREETDGLCRTVRIFHAVVAGLDHSGGTLHSWRNLRRKPLDIAVAREPDRFSQLSQLLAKRSASGIKLDCDLLVSELNDLWSSSPGYRLTPQEIADAIRRFMSMSMAFPSKEPMQTVYDAARSTLENSAI